METKCGAQQVIYDFCDKYMQTDVLIEPLTKQLLTNVKFSRRCPKFHIFTTKFFFKSMIRKKKTQLPLPYKNFIATTCKESTFSFAKYKRYLHCVPRRQNSHPCTFLRSSACALPWLAQLLKWFFSRLNTRAWMNSWFSLRHYQDSIKTRLTEFS